MSTAIPGSITIDLTANASLRRLERLAWFADSAIRIAGTRRSFGADGLLGVIPGVGSLAGTGLSPHVLAQATLHRVPPRLLGRMGLNVAADMVLGSIPVAGVVFDMMFKANQRNLALLRDHLAEVR